jgi:choline dehydrogenase
MGYLHGTANSYARWAEMVGDSSYTYSALQPYFKKSTTFTPPDMSQRATNATPTYNTDSFGRSGELDVTFPDWAMAFPSYLVTAMRESGIQPLKKGMTNGELLGSAYVAATIQPATQSRESSQTAFLNSDVLARKNLKLYQRTLARKIVFDERKRAVGVDVSAVPKGQISSQNDAKVIRLRAKKEVVLSAGTFQSPQLLMVSGVGPKESLERHRIPIVAESPGVGQNMWASILSLPLLFLVLTNLGRTTF